MNTSKFALLLLALLSPTLTQAQVPQFEWVVQSGLKWGTFDAVVDGDGSIYAAGSCEYIIAKYSKNGERLWVAKEDTSQCGLVSYQLALDSEGNVYATGWLRNTVVTVDGVQLTASGDSGIFIAKYDPEGNLIWIINDGTGDLEQSYDITVDREGNVYITGLIGGRTRLAGTDLGAQEESHLFVAKYDRDANPMWAVSSRSGYAHGGTGIAVDAKGNAYVTSKIKSGFGLFGDDIEVHGGTHGASVLVKYDHNGNAVWVNVIQTDKGLNLSSEVFISNGHIIMLGSVRSASQLGDLHIAEKGLFIASFDFMGNGLWVKSFPGSLDASYLVGATSGDGSIYLSGNRSEMDFGQGVMAGGAFVAKFDPLGDFLWAKPLDSPTYIRGIDVSSTGEVVIAGTKDSNHSTEDHLDLDGFSIPLDRSTGQAGFLAKIGAKLPSASLDISREGSDLIITYPSWEGAILESTEDLNADSWEPTGVPGHTPGGGRVTVLVARDVSKRFFRLRLK